ncbi:MAG: hypothetical protein DYG89_08005 [Caldilinea sp. CFX5]|nr:hypothetical protein [Caldilinea sp. CFX5]
MRTISLLFAFLLAGCALLGYTTIAAAQGASGDMISPKFDSAQCLTVDGAANATPAIKLQACRGANNQYWVRDVGASKWRTALDNNYCLATVDNAPSASAPLTVRLCTDSRALTLEPNPTLADSYRIAGTAYVLDTGVYGYVAIAHQNGWSYQYWRWFQDDLSVVNAQGCAITYPFPATDTATYNRELACDRVSKVQPPYVMPAAAVRTTMFPGAVAAGLPAVTQSFAFNLQFKDHGYLRMSAPPQNWQSTGLYAPPNQLLRVTVSNAAAADLSEVYAQIGVHMDILEPTSGNVEGGNFDRHPSVVVRVKLVPGENLVRSPYGGPVILVSEASVNKTIDVEVANAVQAPYFKSGETTEAQWLARRALGIPYAEIEGELAIIHVPTSEISNVSYADIQAVAAYYTQMVRYHNALSGLSDNAALPHQSPQGKQRHVEDIQITAGWGHSGFPAMYFNAWRIGVPEEYIYRSAAWGVYHELGHNYQMGGWSYVYGVEATVNLWSLHAQEAFFGNSSIVDDGTYAKAIAILNNNTITNKWGSAGAFEQLVFLDQIRLAFPQQNWNLWTQLMRRYREMSDTEYNALDTDQKRRDKFLEILCDLTNSNLTPHFDQWTIAISNNTKSYCATKLAMTQQPWTIDGAQPLYYSGGGTGNIRREWWTGLPGATLADLTNAPAYPTQPTGTALVTGTLEGPRDWGSDFGDRLRGYLHPPVTGNYDFWLAGNEAVQFRLSTDEDPLNTQSLLTVAQATGYRGFDDHVASIQRSQPVALVAGRNYYFEVIRKESSGGDHVAVAWSIPAGPTTPREARKVIDGRYLSPYRGDLALRKQLTAGQAATIPPGGDVNFTISVFNQSTATVKNIQIVETLPISFTLSPLNQAGQWISGYRYVRLQALSEAGNRGPWTSMAELNVLDGNGQPLAQNQWRLLYADSENPDSPATNAFDGNPATLWHTMWWSTPPAHPHEIQIDLGGRYTLSGFTYLPRQSGYNGRIGNYRFYVSSDGVDWVQVVSGTFPDNANLQRVNFTTPPSRQAFGVIPGPIAPGASANATIILRAEAAIALGNYTNHTEILGAQDALNSRIYDADSTADANATNDVVVDNRIDNSGGDEDDHDIAIVQVGTVAPQSTITILVDAQPESIQNFRFGGNLTAFSLDDANPDDGDTVPNSRSFIKAAGSYVVSQTVPAGWVLAAINCVPAEKAQVELNAQRVTITASGGDNVACTFVDQRTAKVNARKFQDSNGDKRRQATELWLPGWTMTVYNSSGAVAATGVTGSSGQIVLSRLPPGSYTICETRQSGWNHTLPTTLNATYNQPCYPVTLQPNQTATSTFGNRPAATIAEETPPPTDLPPDDSGVTISDGSDVPFDESGYDGHDPDAVDENQPVQDQMIFLPVIQR